MRPTWRLHWPATTRFCVRRSPTMVDRSSPPMATASERCSTVPRTRSMPRSTAQRALAAETWPGDLRLLARMGLETGTARERDGSYLGPVPNRAARIMAAAHGGQVLVGARTAALLDGAELVDLGDHRLPDLPRAERLFQVFVDGAPAQFPAPRTRDAQRGNLPMPATSLIGREQILADLMELVRAHRLVTLTGVGGVGKTRLSVEVGTSLADEHPDGVWMVELAPLTDPAAVSGRDRDHDGRHAKGGNPVDPDAGRRAVRAARARRTGQLRARRRRRGRDSARAARADHDPARPRDLSRSHRRARRATSAGAAAHARRGSRAHPR